MPGEKKAIQLSVQEGEFVASEIRHLHLSSRDHAVSQLFYETYFGFRFDADFPRGEEPAAHR